MAGALPDAERAAIADHAASCDGCHALIEGLIESGTRRAPASGGTRGTGDPQATLAQELGRGTRVGRYVIGEPLGVGGMSVVHAAFDLELHRRVALKVLRRARHREDGSTGQDRLIREARWLARVSHPNVVTVFDVGVHRGQLFIAMELVDGGSLRAWLRRAPRTIDEIIDCLLDAGRGLAASHAAGVVHRDIKPDNILVGLDGRARVTDFGLAQRGAALLAPDAPASAAMRDASMNPARTGRLMGTPAYMAPEQLLAGVTDARSDQWSFCATLYEALAGVRPFVVGDLAASSAAIAESRFAAPAPGRQVPGWVRPIVTRGLRADPSARWPSMDALVRALAPSRPHRNGRP
jgi:serine/threonine protein kinase